MASYTSIAEPRMPVIAVSAATWLAGAEQVSALSAWGNPCCRLKWRRGPIHRKQLQMALQLTASHSSYRSGAPPMNAWKPRCTSSLRE